RPSLHDARPILALDDLLDPVLHLSSLRRDPQFVNGAIRERGGERAVDELVLLDEREALEAGARDRHLEVVAAAGAVRDRDLVAGKRVAQESLQPLRHFEFARPCARYSSRSERVSIPVGLPRVATTTAGLPPPSAGPA